MALGKGHTFAKAPKQSPLITVKETPGKTHPVTLPSPFPVSYNYNADIATTDELVWLAGNMSGR